MHVCNCEGGGDQLRRIAMNKDPSVRKLLAMKRIRLNLRAIKEKLVDHSNDYRHLEQFAAKIFELRGDEVPESGV